MARKTFPVQVPITARKRLSFIAGAHDLDLGAAVAYLVDDHECVLEHQMNDIDAEAIAK